MVNVCSTLNKPFELAGMSPMILPDLFLILHDLFSKWTLYPESRIQPIEMIVSAISGAWRVLHKVTGVVLCPLGTLICKSPVPIA